MREATRLIQRALSKAAGDGGGSCAEALADARGALGAEPENAALRVLMGRILYDRGERSEAAREFERASALDPSNLLAKAFLALAFLAGERVAEGVERMSFCENAEFGGRLLLWLVERTPQSERGEQDKGEAPAPPEGAAGAAGSIFGALKARFLVWRGMRLYDRKEYERSRELFERARNLSPNLALLDACLGEAYFRTGRERLGEPFVMRVLARQGDNPVALQYAGRLALERGEAARALELLGESVRLEPAEAESHFHLARALAASGDRTRALAECVEAARWGPGLVRERFEEFKERWERVSR